MQRIQLFITLFAALAIIGCGPSGLDTQFVEGTVTFDGEPLAGAVVTFHPVDREHGKTAAGNTDERGRFTLNSDGGLPGRGAVAGDYTITVVKVEIIPQTPPAAFTRDQDPDRPMEYSIQRRITPNVYSTREGTPFRETVQRGRNAFTFEMTSGAR